MHVPKVFGVSIVMISIIMLIGMYIQIKYPSNAIGSATVAKLPTL